MLWDWRKWLFLVLLLLWLPLFRLLLPLRLGVSHTLSPKMRREWKYNPPMSTSIFKPSGHRPLSFSHTDTVLSCKGKNNLSAWDYGIPSFVDYMNNVYIPFREEQFDYITTRVVYAKYGNPGIANQMKCACDTLLYALLTNRTFQSGIFFDNF